MRHFLTAVVVCVFTLNAAGAQDNFLRLDAKEQEMSTAMKPMWCCFEARANGSNLFLLVPVLRNITPVRNRAKAGFALRHATVFFGL
jgi:hypothetical protein